MKMQVKIAVLLFWLLTFLGVFSNYAQNIVYNDEVEENTKSNEIIFNCSKVLNLQGCNYIPNPSFATNSSPNYGQSIISAFANNDVALWADSHGSSDINYNLTTSIVSPPLAQPNMNYVHMVSGIAYNPITGIYEKFGEGICAKIKPLQVGKEYAFSMFGKAIYASASNSDIVKFTVRLIKCKNFIEANNTFNIPSVPSANQLISCEERIFTNDNWEQSLSTFVANDEYDMIWIYPEVFNGGSNNASFSTFVAYPQLIDITPSINISYNANSCPIGLSYNCNIENASFSWYNPSGNYIGNSQQIAISANVSGTYTLKISTPSSPNVNNSCGGISTINKKIYVLGCNNTLEIAMATVEKMHKNDGINPNGYVTVNLLSNLSSNNLAEFCHFIDEGILKFDLTSNQMNGNFWEIFRDGILAPNPNSPATMYSTPTVPNNTLQNYSPSIVFVDFTSPTTFEIRLTNTILGQVKSLFVKIKPQAEILQGSCYLESNGNIKIGIDGLYNTNSNTKYLWNFSNGPAGFASYVSMPYANNPTIVYDPVASGLTNDFVATVITQNSTYGCERQRQTLIVSNIINCQGLYGKNNENKNLSVRTLNKEELSIYPNPISSVFKIQSINKISMISIKSMEGKLLKIGKANGGNTIDTNISEFSKGMYIVTILFVNGTSTNKIIVKK